MDLIAYNLAAKPAGPLENTSGHITLEAANRTHGFMKSVLGGDQSDLGVPELVMTGDVVAKPPFLGISDQYYEFIRSKNIRLVRGKVTNAPDSSSNSIFVQDGEDQHTLNDVAAVVFATGFDPASSLSFLPEHVLKDLDFDATSDTVPLGLGVHGSISSTVPSLGFVGFYRSPYWGVMQMQAKFLGKFWSGDEKAAEALATDKTLQGIVSLRNNPRAAQFPMGDYAYLMESFSEILNIKRIEPKDSPEGSRSGIVIPSRYLNDGASESELQQSATEISVVEKILKGSSESGKLLPRAIFRGMQGDWKLERDIVSRRSDYPSGKLSGSAYFHPRTPTEDLYDFEYLYNESGEFVSEQGFRFTATRR